MTGASQWKEASPPSTFWLNLNNGSLHIGGTPPGPAGRCSALDTADFSNRHPIMAEFSRANHFQTGMVTCPAESRSEWRIEYPP
jgi:hypothetical protein